MQYQTSLNHTIYLSGIEPFGGNEIEVRLSPLPSDFGIRFRNPSGDSLPIDLSQAEVRRKAISLVYDGGIEISHVEHILATLYAMEVDNCEIELRSKKFRDNLLFVPNFPEREKSLCEKILQVGTHTLPEKRKFFKISELVETQKLTLIPQKGSNVLNISVTTDYPYYGGNIERNIDVTPKNYLEVARSRAFAKEFDLLPLPNDLLVNLVSLYRVNEVGFGHGINKDLFLYPSSPLESFYKEQERVGFEDRSEITRHGIVDRLGAFAILSQTLGGRITETEIKANQSGHINDLEVLKRYQDKFIPFN